MSKTSPRGEKLRESVRVTKIQVDTVDGGEWKETISRWFSTMDMVRRAANLLYETWLVWHIQNQSREKLEAWLSARKEHGKTEAGKCPVQCMPKELTNLIYEKLTRQFPEVHNRVLGLLQNKLSGDLRTKVAANGSLPGWSATLLHHQGMPSITKREYPIPFDLRNARLVKEGNKRILELTTWRVPRDGKSATSITDRIVLMTNGRKCTQVAKECDNLLSGEWAFKGANLIYDDKRRKWSVHLGYQCPSRVAKVDDSLRAVLIPGRNNPFYIRTSQGRKEWLQGRGNHITGLRERLWLLRAEKSSAYRFASARKGHGRKASHKWRAKSSQTWRHFTKRVNHEVSKRAVDWCVANGVGHLVYCQPSGDCANNRFVSGSFKNSTWEFHQLASLLAYKCQDRGVQLTVVKCGGQSEPLSKSA